MTQRVRSSSLRRLAASSLAWACLLAACSHQANTANSRPEPSSDNGQAGAISAGVATTLVQEPPAPLLLDPRLSEVRRALEERDDELAASVLIAMLPELGKDNRTLAQGYYLLGVIEQRRGDSGSSIAAFENASQTPWLLDVDAYLHLIELELARDNCARVAELLDQLRTLDATVELELERSQLDLCRKDWPAGVRRLRQLLDSTQDAQRRARLRALLALGLSEGAKGGAWQQDAADEEIAQLAHDTLAHRGATEADLDRARMLLDDVSARRQRSNVEDVLRDERTALLEALVESNRWAPARQLALELLAQSAANPRTDPGYCRVMFANGKVLARFSERDAARDAYAWVSSECDDPDLAARAKFLEASLLSSAGKRALSINGFAELERRFPEHRLADDARLRRALLYRAIGSESQFVDLLDRLPDDYPGGDMVQDGLFQLALKNMVERNWSSALAVLERAERVASSANAKVRDIERDRLEYFLGRANYELGRHSIGTSRWQSIVSTRPLTYYMLLAHSALKRTEAQRATEALQNGIASANASSDTNANRSGMTHSTARLLSLLGVGDTPRADSLLRDASSELESERVLALIAGMYSAAGAPKTALTLVKTKGRDWRIRWPSGDWLAIWQQAFPRPFHDTVQKELRRSQVDEALVYAVMREESEFEPRAASQADAFGLMQLIVPTAKTAGRELGIPIDESKLKVPSTNIAVGARVLSKLMERFSGQVPLVAAAYNAGPGRAARWLQAWPNLDLDLWVELIEYPETRGYVKRVLESQAAYLWLYGTPNDEGPHVESLPLQLRARRGD